MHATTRRPRVAILQNEILPYRIPLYQAIHDQGKIDSMVFYSARRSWERNWRIDPTRLNYPHHILPGFYLMLPKKKFLEKRTTYFNPTLFWELIHWKPNVVIGYEYSVPAQIGLLYARLAHIPYLVFSECTTHTDRALTRGQRWMRRWVIPRADGFLGVSRAACQNLIAMGADPARVHEAPQAHAVADFSKQTRVARAARPHADPRILYAGSLIERKGVGLLLESFRIVAASNPAAQLRIVGSGPLEQALRQTVERNGLGGRVTFAGFVEPARMPDEYSQATVFALPTLEDTFGVVVVEALAAGIPVICSPFAGAAEYLEDGTDAFLADPNQPALWADRIQRLLSDSALCERFAIRGRAIADHFEAASVAQIFLLAVRQALTEV